jgi:hypothetical protein
MDTKTIKDRGYLIITLYAVIYEYGVNGRNGTVLNSGSKDYYTKEAVGYLPVSLNLSMCINEPVHVNIPTNNKLYCRTV